MSTKLPEPFDQQVQAAAAFSRKAAVYDLFGQDHPNLARMRERVYTQFGRWTPSGSTVLELNAGTGLDAVALIQRGYRVHATDIAPGMVAEIQRKQAVLGLNGRLTVQQCSFTNLDAVQAGPFEAVFSNFGGLNCIADLTAVTKHLPRLLKPNGVLTWVIMPPICPWELLLTVKDWRVGTRRLRRGGVTAHVEGVPLQTYYFTPRQVRQALGGEFKLLELTALSLLTPTADNKTFARRYAQFYQWLVWLDERVSAWPLLNQMGDFFILTARYEPR